MTKDSFVSLLMGLIYDLKFEERFIDRNADKLWKKWRWFRALNLASALEYLEDMEKMFTTLLAEILDLDEDEMHRIYKEIF